MTSRKISLDGTHQQLIEINSEAKYFEANITVIPSEADKEKTYEIGIITQEKLDAGVVPKIASISGKFSKTIKVTEGDYQSYCLIIKSSEPFTDMDIQINIDEFVEQNIEHEPAHTIAPPSMDATHAMMQDAIKQREGGNKMLKYIIGALIILVGGFFLYHFWKSKKIETKQVGTEIPSVEQPVVELPVEFPSLSAKTPSKTTFSFY